MKAKMMCWFLYMCTMVAVGTGCSTSAGFTEQLASEIGTTALPAAGWGDPGVVSSDAPSGWPSGSVSFCCTVWWIPVDTVNDDLVGGISLRVKDNGGLLGNNLIVSLVDQSSTSSTWTTLGTVTSAGDGSTQTLSITLGTPHKSTAGHSLLVRIAALSGGSLPGPATLASTLGPVEVRGADPEPNPDPSITTISFSPTLIRPAAGTAITIDALATLPGVGFSGGAGVSMPLTLPVGATIGASRVFVTDTTTGPTHLVAYLIKHPFRGVATPIYISNISLGDGSWQTLTLSPPGETVQSATSYDILVLYDRGSGLSYLSGVEVDIQQ